MAHYLFLKHTKTSLTPYAFQTYNFEKLVNFYIQESKNHPDIIFIYKCDERTNQYLPCGYIMDGVLTKCSSYMFNFRAYLDK